MRVRAGTAAVEGGEERRAGALDERRLEVEAAVRTGETRGALIQPHPAESLKGLDSAGLAPGRAREGVLGGDGALDGELGLR